MSTLDRSRARAALAAALPLALCLAGCKDDSQRGAAAPQVVTIEAPARAGIAITEPREALTRDGLYQVTWMPVGGFVPVNEHFELDVTVARAGEGAAPVANAAVVVDCQMPAHGHGMLREPRSEALGDGRYRVRGMLLHMGGHWTVTLNVLVDGVASTADDAIDL
ncbi:MAG: FixH family protein [Planctomycetota bacterium]